jgi:hypothetical protein
MCAAGEPQRTNGKCPQDLKREAAAAWRYLRLSIAARSGCATLASGAERSTVHDDADAIAM